MSVGKRIVTAVVTVAVLCGVGAGGYTLWKKYGGAISQSNEKVYVQKVSNINSVTTGALFANDYSGVIVAQKSVDVKYDTSKTIKEMLVENGDTVKKGDKLLNYDVEQINLEIETAKLEVERLENGIKANEDEIKQLEEEKKKASEDIAVSYTTQILSLQSDNARSEYDIKAKNVEIQKLEASLGSAYVTAPLDGVVSNIKENTGSSSDYDDYDSSGDVIMKITAEGNFRVKGIFNEQNAGDIYQGAPVILRSRIDDTTWRGTISEIDASPQQNNNNMYMGESDEQTSSSKYAFYVEPESLDGFMLGQHIIIEMDYGQSEETQKTGIWLISDFIQKDGDKSFVWAKNDDKDMIEKRYVELGATDPDAGDTEILSGLTNSDYIAYPADYIKSGMKTTTNQSDVSVPDNDLEGGEDYGEDYEDYEDYEGGEMGEDTFTDEMGNTYIMNDDGTLTIQSSDGMTYYVDDMGNVTDDDGNSYQFDEEGNIVPFDGEPVTDGGYSEGTDMMQELYGISEEELAAMTDEEREEFFKNYYSENEEN